MFYRKTQSKSKWQKTFIRDVFQNKTSKQNTFSKIILQNLELLKPKEGNYPIKLCKFYSPTSDNILDIQKQRLWLSHPHSFNDPFDCHVGYDIEEFERRYLIQYIKNNFCDDQGQKKENFTTEELNRIQRSKTYVHHLESFYRGTEEYYDVKRKILEGKSEDFNRKVRELISKSKEDVENKVVKIRHANIRVSCFSALTKDDKFKEHIAMWSHYADNHKGFCVEYDLSFLKEPTSFEIEDHKYHDESYHQKYLDERLRASIKAGLFPIIYSSSRVNIPFTKLQNVKIDDDGNIKHHSDIDAILYKTYIVKSSNWSSEKEWRLIIDGKISNYYDNKIPFPYVKRVYLGCKIDSQTKSTIIDIGKELDFEVVTLIMNENKFILEEENIQYSEWDREWRRKFNNPFK